MPTFVLATPVTSGDPGQAAWLDSTLLPSSGWSLLGNAGTNAAVNFLGTTDAVDLVLRANNTERLRILSTGNAQFNVTNAVEVRDGKQLRLYEPAGSGTSYSSFQAPAQAADINYTLPNAQATATNQFLRNDGAGTLSWREALVNFTESTVSFSGQRSVTLAATNAATNVWAVLQPKGTGGVQADTPDGGVAGGNIRGAYAVDWQGERTAATQVASGNTATIGGGWRNTASGDRSVVCGGSNNTASGTESGIVGGLLNQATGQGAFVGGGNENVAAILNSSIPGGLGSVTTIDGEMSLASGYFAVAGDAQQSWVTLRYAYLVGIVLPVELTTTGGVAVPGSFNFIQLSDNSAYQFSVKVMARDVGAVNSAWWKIEGGIERRVGEATTALVGVPVTDTGNSGGSAAGWTCTVAADGSAGKGSLQILVTAPGATGTVNFVASVHLAMVR